MEQQTLLDRADGLLGAKQDMELRRLLLSVESAAISDIIATIPRGKRKIFSLLPPEVQADVIIPLPDEIKETVLSKLSDYTIARFVHFNAEDDATDILQHVAPERRAGILEKIRPDRRSKIEKLLTFGSETAGGLMDLNFLIVKRADTVAEVLEQIRAHFGTQRQIPVVLVMDEHQRLRGSVPHRNLLFTAAKTSMETIMQSLPVFPFTTDREQIIDTILKQKSELACVVDENNQPLGIIHLRDLLQAAEAEGTEDVYYLAGLQKQEHPLNSILTKVKLRSAWLIMNLATAFLASFVVSLFADSISQLAMLAVFMPVVAGVGGNTGTQALAVVVRGLAVGEINWSNARPVIIREALAGLLNGILVGSIAGGMSLFFGASPMLGLVLALAMMINLFVAGLFGSLIPFILKSLGVDPAISSSIFVTAATDSLGFLAFLGLGTWLLL